MTDAPQDVYAKSLPIHFGYPLWNPEPSSTLPSSHQQDGLQIGDVGIVDPDCGFDVFFNVCRSHHHALHARHGVPQFHDPVQLKYEDDYVKGEAIRAGSVIFSSGVHRDLSLSETSSVKYQFRQSSPNGAILILPHGAQFHDIRSKSQFHELAIRNATRWYEFAVQKLQRPISTHSLYLITGFYKARSWSLASFQNVSPAGGLIKVVKMEDGSNSGNYRWESEFPMTWKDGPGRGYNGNTNQSVFLRGYKIALRDGLFGLRAYQPVVEELHRQATRVSFLSLFKWLLHKIKKRSMNRYTHGMGNIPLNLTHEPQLSQPFHYSDVINSYLLKQHPTASVAITHDSEWMGPLETGELKPEDLVQDGYLEIFVSGKYTFDSQGGTVYLQSKGCLACVSGPGIGNDPLGRLEVFETSEPSSDDSRIVITQIRGEHIAVGLGRTPIECYVSIQSGSTKGRTSNKFVSSGEVIEWDDLIPLPFESSAMLHLSIRVSSEFVSTTAHEETLHELSLSVADLIDRCEKGQLIEFSPEAGDVEMRSLPSLLITTDHRSLDDIVCPASPTTGSRERSLFLAKVAEEAKCWEDLVNYMKNIASLDWELTPEERDLFSVGYRSLIGVRRASWRAISSAEQEEESKGNAARLALVKCYKQKLEGEIVDICEDVLDVLDKHLIPCATSGESTLFYGQMVGDYHRCLSEFAADSRRKECIEKALAAYENASNFAVSALRETHPIRLRLALSFSSFYDEILDSRDQATRVAQRALCDARAGLDGLSEAEYHDAMLVMKLLQDNVARWRSDNKEKLKDEQGEGENSKTDKNVPREIDGDLHVQLAGDLIRGMRSMEKSRQEVVHDAQPVDVHQQSFLDQAKFPSKKVDINSRIGRQGLQVPPSQIIKEGLPRKRRIAKHITGFTESSRSHKEMLPRKRVKMNTGVQSD